MKYFMLRKEEDVPLIVNDFIFDENKYIEGIKGLEHDAIKALEFCEDITLMINIRNVTYETIIMLIAVINACNSEEIKLSILYLDGTNPCYQQKLFDYDE